MSHAKPPVILSPDEMARFLEAATGSKYKAALSVGYGSGAASLGDCFSEGHRYRFPTHDVAYRTGQGSQMLCTTFETLCVREIYVAMALLLPAAKPLSVIITTHKFLPFHRQTTHCIILACLYARGAHLPEDQPENDKPRPLYLR
jgi:hypothetical protein